MITLAPERPGALDAIKIIAITRCSRGSRAHRCPPRCDARCYLAERGSRLTCSMRCGRSTTVSLDRFVALLESPDVSSNW